MPTQNKSHSTSKSRRSIDGAQKIIWSMVHREKTATEIVSELQRLGYISEVIRFSVFLGVKAEIPRGRSTSVYPPKLKAGP